MSILGPVWNGVTQAAASSGVDTKMPYPEGAPDPGASQELGPGCWTLKAQGQGPHASTTVPIASTSSPKAAPQKAS